MNSTNSLPFRNSSEKLFLRNPGNNSVIPLCVGRNQGFISCCMKSAAGGAKAQPTALQLLFWCTECPGEVDCALFPDIHPIAPTRE